jgi:hypothetical protein
MRRLPVFEPATTPTAPIGMETREHVGLAAIAAIDERTKVIGLQIERTALRAFV